MSPPSDDLSADRSNGYDEAAPAFAERREQTTIGAGFVGEWSKALPAGASVLDVGCGSGVPISLTLVDAGFDVWGIDASARMVGRFKDRFPLCQVLCEAIEDSAFFARTFDGVVAWGLIFLLAPDTQAVLIEKMARALVSGGRLLFTAPAQSCEWPDLLTGKQSRSLGRKRYVGLLSINGLSLVEELDDEGENHYYHAIKE